MMTVDKKDLVGLCYGGYGLSLEFAQVRNKWRRKITGQHWGQV